MRTDLRVLLLNRGRTYEVGSFFWNALMDLGLQIDWLDTRNYYLKGINRFNFAYIKLFGKFIRHVYNLNIISKVNIFKPDLVLIVKGNDILSQTLEIMKAKGIVLINYATDDPFNKRVSSVELRSSIRYFDFYFCTKKSIMNDVRLAGCKYVFYLPFGYDPNQHYPDYPKNKKELNKFQCDVVFIGEADDERICLISEMQKISGINIHFYGGYWGRYHQMKKNYKGYAFDRNYRLAISSSKISLGLVRHSNRDGHSMRTFEIPACGGFMLAERTDDHLSYLIENKEFICFDSKDEFFDKIIFYMKHSDEREQIRKNGYLRIINGGHTYKERIKYMFKTVEKNL